MSFLSENLKVLIWKNKGEFSNKTYSEYINHVANQCNIAQDRFRSILCDDVDATSMEVKSLTDFFRDYGYDLSAIQYMFLFDELVAKSTEELLTKNIQHLLKSLNRGQNADFIENVGVNPSTVSRWKNGTTRPDSDSQSKICSYFGYQNARLLKYSLLFLGLEPISCEQRKQQCKEMIEHMDKESFERIYPALLKLLS